MKDKMNYYQDFILLVYVIYVFLKNQNKKSIFFFYIHAVQPSYNLHKLSTSIASLIVLFTCCSIDNGVDDLSNPCNFSLIRFNALTAYTFLVCFVDSVIASDDCDESSEILSSFNLIAAVFFNSISIFGFNSSSNDLELT